MNLVLTTCSFVSATVIVTSCAFADTWIVDDNGKGDFNSIQSAIDFASDGDEIFVMPGTYTGGQSDAVVNMIGKSIWLHSAMGANATFIDGEDIRRGILCVNGETSTTIIEGFTIENCDATWFDYDGDGNSDSWETAGGGMGIAYSSPRIIDCLFQTNNGHRGGAGMFNFVSNPSVEHCSFLGNEVDEDGSGCGMLNRDNSSPVINDCIFSYNIAGYLGGGIYNYDGSSPVLTDCTFSYNIANYIGGGMYCRFFSNAVLVNCTFQSNEAMFGGGGLYCSSLSDPMLTGCLFVDNRTTSNSGNGGGLGISNSDPVIQNCVFSSNEASINGGGLHFGIGCNATIIDCNFNNNVAGNNGGGAYFDFLNNNTILNSSFEENSATQNGGGVWCSNQSVVTLSGSTIQGNDAALGGDILLRKNSQLVLEGTNNAGEVTLLHLGTSLVFSPNSLFLVNDSLSPAEQGSLGFDVDAFDSPVPLVVNGTLIRQGSLSVTNDSGSLSSAIVGDIVSLLEATTLSQSTFDSIVLPQMPEGLGLQAIQQPLKGGNTSIAIEVVEDVGADFDEPIVAPLDGTPVDIISFDIEGDGKDEIAILYGGAPSIVTVFAMANDGTPPVLITSLTTQVGNGALDFDSGDLNGDGKEDIVVANADDGTISVLKTTVSDGTYIFSTTTIPVPGNLHAVTNIAVIDWDSNADADVVVGVDVLDESLQDRNQVLLNVATSSPTPGPTFSIPTYHDGLTEQIDSSSAADGLGSGFVCGTTFGGIYSASLGNTELQLLGHLDGNNVSSIDVLDIDDDGGDGQLDLVIASDDAQSIYLMQGDVSEFRNFGSLIPISVSEKVYDVVATDADGDGDVDFILATPESTTPLLLLRNGGLVGLLPGGMTGRTWNKQDSGSETNSDKVTGGDLDDKGEDLDWDYFAGTSGQDNITGGPAGSVEQVNIIFTTCLADFNADDIVNVQDLLTLIAAWGPCGGCETDLNTDGDVNVSDLLILIAAWGPCGQ